MKMFNSDLRCIENITARLKTRRSTGINGGGGASGGKMFAFVLSLQSLLYAMNEPRRRVSRAPEAAWPSPEVWETRETFTRFAWWQMYLNSNVLHTAARLSLAVWKVFLVSSHVKLFREKAAEVTHTAYTYTSSF